MRVALAGNPNSGKTTLFNALTGSNQYVGNWPGVTVEKKGGKLKADKSIEITDLPGIYSLSPYTLEEVVARNFLIQEKPDAILNIVDGSNLERNLYLTTQLLEMGVPVVVAVNMMDVVRKRGDEIHADQLAKELGCNVVEISALKNEGIDEVVNCLKTIGSAAAPTPITFSAVVEEAISTIEGRLPSSVPINLKRFYAIKLLEKDSKIAAAFEGAPDVSDVVAKVEKESDDDTESVIINDRYSYISTIIDHCRSKNMASQLTTSDKIDRVVTNRILALPIFVVVMFLVYYISVSTVGTIATDWANDGVFGDGWYLGSGQEQFDEVSEEFESAQESVDAFEAAAEEEDLDPASETFIEDAEAAGLTATYESYDDETGENETVEVDAGAYQEALDVLAPYQGDQNAIAAFEAAAIEEGLDPESEDFADEAADAGIIATYVDENGETQEVDADTYAEEVEGSEPDPTEYGMWVPGIPV
ncbi:MAG: ferrous iron transporter B, partial [Eggerthellaceae bacterium]|nr:ferrous iron transporter B [Eggerthellaceae bacterium]